MAQLAHCLPPTTGEWDPHATPAKMAARQDFAANVLQPMLDKATPRRWRVPQRGELEAAELAKEFFGSNYPKLLSIKKKYDPDSVLYANNAVE